MPRLAVSTLTAAVLLSPALAFAQAAGSPPPAAPSPDASASVSVGAPMNVPPPPPGAPVTEIVAQPPRPVLQGSYQQPYVPAYSTQMYGAMLRPVLYSGGPIPPGTHIERRAFTGLAISGGVLFAVTYLSTAVAAALTSSIGNTALLYIPVFGPTIWVAGQPGAPGGSVAFFVIDSILQAGGIAMFIGGFMVHRPWLVPDRGLVTRPHDRRIAWTLTPGPSTAPAGVGVALVW